MYRCQKGTCCNVENKLSQIDQVDFISYCLLNILQFYRSCLNSSLSLSLLALTLTHPLSLTCTETHSHNLTHTLSLSLSHTHSLTHTLSLFLNQVGWLMVSSTVILTLVYLVDITGLCVSLGKSMSLSMHLSSRRMRVLGDSSITFLHNTFRLYFCCLSAVHIFISLFFITHFYCGIFHF